RSVLAHTRSYGRSRTTSRGAWAASGAGGAGVGPIAAAPPTPASSPATVTLARKDDPPLGFIAAGDRSRTPSSAGPSVRARESVAGRFLRTSRAPGRRDSGSSRPPPT